MGRITEGTPDIGPVLPNTDSNPDGPGGSPVPTQTAQQAQLFRAAQSSPVNLLQQQWRPGSFLDFHTQIIGGSGVAAQASFNLDKAIQQGYQNDVTLTALIASRQAGVATVIGSLKSVATGLRTVNNCSGSIDLAGGAHNFWLSITPSATPGGIDIFVWQPTSAANNTPIACTTAVSVRWIADGVLV